MGTCSAPNCNACLDTAGNCRTDKMIETDNDYCGRDGGFCSRCDTVNGQQCTNGRCIGTTGACTAANCPNGCCSGNTCVQQQTNAQCGLGGAQCATCTGATCNADAGVCVGSGGDGGFMFPDLDGGFGTPCDVTSCPTGCCNILLGCQVIGSEAGGAGSGLFSCKDPATGFGDVCLSCLDPTGLFKCSSPICF